MLVDVAAGRSQISAAIPLERPNVKPIEPPANIDRRALVSIFALLPTLSAPFLSTSASAQTATSSATLPPWNEGPAKQEILDFVGATTDATRPQFVPSEKRIATFDQDGTLWVEHPMYSQLMYRITRAPLLTGDRETAKACSAFQGCALRQSGGDRQFVAARPRTNRCHESERMTVDYFIAEVKKWPATAKDSRWKRPYTDLTSMQEVMNYLRANGYKTYFVTGGGEDFVRQYSESVYGIPPTQVVGSAGGTKFGYDNDGRPFLTKDWRLLVNDNNAGKPESIQGQRPCAAFGNSTGDQQMLEYTGAGDGARLMMLVLHDDAQREYAYGPVQGLPAFTSALYDEATKRIGR